MPAIFGKSACMQSGGPILIAGRVTATRKLLGALRLFRKTRDALDARYTIAMSMAYF
jgi:hypothetical protein